MARLPALDPAKLAPEQRAVYDKIANSPRGGVRGPFLALMVGMTLLAHDVALPQGTPAQFG